MTVNVIGGNLSQEEIDQYVSQIKNKYTDRIISRIDFTVDGEYVDVKTTFSEQPFFRLRRITGYLTNSLDRWNNGKKAEEKDRVKHTV